MAVHGQSAINSFHPSRPLSLSAIDQWTTDNGLISNNLTSVVQSQNGFLWITTYNGLLRFDGETFEQYDRENTPFLQTDAFYQGFVNGDKTWFTTQGSGIILVEDNKLEPFYAEQLPKSIRCLLISKEGDIWVGSNNNGLFLIRDSTVIKQQHELVRDISIMGLARDIDGSIWVATNGNGVIKVTDDQYEQFSTQQGLSGNVVNAIACTEKGEVYIGTTKGFDILSNSTIHHVGFLKNQLINSILIDDIGSVWLATERGLARFNDNLGTKELFTNEQGFPTHEVTSMTFDTEGNLWLATSKAGLIQMKDIGISTLSKANGLSDDQINIITEGPDGTMYVGTDGGNIDNIKNGKVTRLNLKNSLKGVSIRDIYIDKPGTMWIASYNGLLRKKGNEEFLINSSNGLPAQDVRRILEGNDGNLWLATRSGGIIKFKNNQVLSQFDKKKGLHSNYILSLEKDNSGNIYAGTNGGGLTRISHNDQITNFNISSDDSGILIFNLSIENDTTIWIVTNVGLYHFNGSSFKKVVFEKFPKGRALFDWVEDDKGSVWITSNKGILRISKDNLLSFINGNTPFVQVTTYDSDDGMKNKECTSATRSIKTSKGEVWVPTIEGAVVIHPDRMIQNSTPPPVYITHLTTDKEGFTNDTTITIKPGNLRYTFSFTGLSLTSPSKNKFKYKLDGFDADWKMSDSRQVDYTNLRPGNYTFRVIASNNDGVWNQQGASLSFSVQPFIYQRPIFYILIILVVLISLFAFYKWRINDIEKHNGELKKINSELDKFVYSASHDLRAPLASVLGLVSIARQDDKKNYETYLTMIEKSIQRLDGFINDIINFSRNARLEIVKEEIHFETVIHEVMDHLKYMDETNRILRIVTVTGHPYFHTDLRRLKIILSNLIGNAIKYHTQREVNSFIEIKVECDAQKAVIRIIDNGQGIAENHLASIFKMFYRANENSKGSGLGLYIVKETVEKIEGVITVTSTLGVGSEFTVTLPALKQ